MPFMAAIPYILQGASMLGGVLGTKKKYIDPEYLRKHFGADAVTKRAQELFSKIMSSPYGNQLMSSAAEQGQRLQTDMGARAAASGLSPDTGGQSAASDFATSAAAGATDSLQRAGRAQVYGDTLPLAQQMVDRERELYLANNAERNATPSTWQRVGNVASQAAAMFPIQPAAATAAPDPAGHRAAAGPTNPNFPAPAPTFAVAPAQGFLQQTQAATAPRDMLSRVGTAESRWRASLQPNMLATRRVGRGSF